MQPIERYGVISLLALVAIITAVILWDQAEDKQPVEAAFNEGGVERPAEPSGLSRNTKPQAAPTGAPKTANWNQANAADKRRQREERDKVVTAELEKARLDLENARQAEAANALLQAEQEKLAAARNQPAKQEERATWGAPVKNTVVDAPSKAAQPKTSEVRSNTLASDAVLPSGTPKAEPKKADGPSYEVRSGDTLSEIAERELGSVKFTAALAAANPSVDPARLLVGQKLVLPSVEGGKATGTSGQAVGRTSAKSAPATEGTYRVQEGDNLWGIAARALGAGERYKDILAANPGLDADRLRVGQLLKLPKGSAAPKVAATEPKTVADVVVPVATSKKGVVR